MDLARRMDGLAVELAAARSDRARLWTGEEAEAVERLLVVLEQLWYDPRLAHARLSRLRPAGTVWVGPDSMREAT